VTISIILLCFVAELCFVTGQLFIKHAMDATNLTPKPWVKVVNLFCLGVATQAGWFFLWAGLLQKKDLSYIYPFEGLSPIMLILGAWLILKEKITRRSLLGIVLISAGVALVSAS
jgi:uncharacterized membrane protein